MAIRKYKLKSGKERWMFSQHLGYNSLGKRIVATRKGFFTWTDANNALNKIKRDFTDGNYTHDSKETYQDLYNAWIELYKDTVKESTLQSTMTMFKLHILPYFGKYKLRDINSLHCQDFVSALSTYVKGNEIFNRAKKVMDYAYKLDLISSNPFEKVIKPKFKKGKKMINFLTAEEVKKLLSVIDDKKWLAYFRLLIITGLRKSEALALHWNDIDFDNNTISISRTLTNGLNNKLIRSTPKTESSTATLLVDDLTMHHLSILKFYTKSVIVFTNSKNTYMHTARPGEALKRYCKKAGIPEVRVHDLRHTCASLMFEAGADIKEVQERLRHSSSKTTMDIYTHVTDKKQQEALNKYVRLLG